METSRKDLLSELASDAALERTDFLVQAADQLRKFLEANAGRISALGGLTLIEDEADYLHVAPDLTFRSRSRFEDETTGEWVSETEVIETPGELVELYNPADIFGAFQDAARVAAGLPLEPTGAEGVLETAGISPEETVQLSDEDAYKGAADDWAAAQSNEDVGDDDEAAARRLYDLALSFQERSQRTEAHLLEQFEVAATRLAGVIGDMIIVDEDDERLTLEASGRFIGEVIPESEAERGEWRRLSSSEQLVEFYDPTDVFGDLAEALAEAYPNVAPELTEGAEAEDGEEGPEGDESSDEDEPEDGSGSRA